jgi:hypothetical protein
MKKLFAVGLLVLALSAFVFGSVAAQAPAIVETSQPAIVQSQVVLQDEVPGEEDGVSDFNEIVTLFKENSAAGGWLALLVLVLVYIGRINGLVVNGTVARIANVTLSTILSGLDPLNPNAEQALVATIAALGSGLLFELIQMGSKRLEEQKKKVPVK